MIAESRSYRLFSKFIDTFSPTGFKEIDPNHPLLSELEGMMSYNNQFFFVADLIQVKLLYTSKRSAEMIGVNPMDVTPYYFYKATRPDDIQRHNLGRSKLFGLALGLYIAEKGYALLSTNLRIRNPVGGYPITLFQCYLFYSPIPVKTVYEIQKKKRVCSLSLSRSLFFSTPNGQKLQPARRYKCPVSARMCVRFAQK